MHVMAIEEGGWSGVMHIMAIEMSSIDGTRKTTTLF